MFGYSSDQWNKIAGRSSIEHPDIWMYWKAPSCTIFKSNSPRSSFCHTDKSQRKHHQMTMTSASSFHKYLCYFIIIIHFSKNPKTTVPSYQAFKEYRTSNLNQLLANTAMSWLTFFTFSRLCFSFICSRTLHIGISSKACKTWGDGWNRSIYSSSLLWSFIRCSQKRP